MALPKTKPAERDTAQQTKYTSEDIRRAIFPKRPRRRSLKEMDKAIAEYVRDKYGRR